MSSFSPASWASLQTQTRRETETHRDTRPRLLLPLFPLPPPPSHHFPLQRRAAPPTRTNEIAGREGRDDGKGREGREGREEMTLDVGLKKPRHQFQLRLVGA
jgi:hypothetical protein